MGDTDRGFCVSEWMSRGNAERIFNKKKKEKVLVTIWAELVYSPTDEEVKSGLFEDAEYVVDAFERKVINILDHNLICK